MRSKGGCSRFSTSNLPFARHGADKSFRAFSDCEEAHAAADEEGGKAFKGVFAPGVAWAAAAVPKKKEEEEFAADSSCFSRAIEVFPQT